MLPIFAQVKNQNAPVRGQLITISYQSGNWACPRDISLNTSKTYALNSRCLRRCNSDTIEHLIIAFAEAVGRQEKDIDKKVCAHTGGSGNEAAEKGDWRCNGKKHGAPSAEKLSEIITRDGVDKAEKGKHWPNGGVVAGEKHGTVAKASEVAENMVNKLSSAEKRTIAGLLSRTISGAEVVEVRAVSTTSVMLNACYDLQGDGEVFQDLGIVKSHCRS